MELKSGYKQTEAGVVPEEWDAVELESITTQIGDGLHGTPTYSANGSYFFINGNNLSDGKIVISDETQSVGKSEYAKYSKPLGDNSILMSINGTIGNLAIFDDQPVVLGKSVAFLNVLPRVSKRFIYHALQAPKVRQQFFGGLTGSTIGNLGLATIRGTKVPLPRNESEQRAIAEALSDMDGLLGGLDRLIAKKRDLKQAAMQQLLTGERRLPGFSAGWHEIELGQLGQFFKGCGVTKDESRSGDIACVRYGELYTHHHDVIRDFTSWISRSVATTAVRLHTGDILFAISGETKEEIGKCAAFISKIEAYAGGDIVIFRPRKSNSVFLGYYLNTRPINRQKASQGQGDAVVHISSAALAAIRCRVPEIAEQTAIAEVLSEMDAELEVLEQRREKTRSLKQAMMQELLTGGIRLR